MLTPPKLARCKVSSLVILGSYDKMGVSENRAPSYKDPQMRYPLLRKLPDTTWMLKNLPFQSSTVIRKS